MKSSSSSFVYLMYITCFILCLASISSVTVVTAVQDSSTQWNACGHDIGYDFTAATTGYKLFHDSRFPDFDFFYSICRPIRTCSNYVNNTWRCASQAKLIPGCETAMLCALNRTSGQGITMFELTSYSFVYVQAQGLAGGSMISSAITPQGYSAFCNNPNAKFSSIIAVFQSYTTEDITAYFYPCSLVINIISPAVLPYTAPAPTPVDKGSSSSNPTAVVFAILFGILFFVVSVAFIVVYRHFQRKLTAASSTASSDQYHLQDAGNVDSDADVQNQNQNTTNEDQNTSSSRSVETKVQV
jgi:hypothetical protein